MENIIHLIVSCLVEDIGKAKEIEVLQLTEMLYSLQVNGGNRRLERVGVEKGERNGGNEREGDGLRAWIVEKK